MARFLTPSKISLLALISIYTESLVPAEAIIPILSFLVPLVVPSPADAEQETAGNVTNQCIILLEDLERETCRLASVIPGRSIWDLLLNELWKIDSLDALHVFFENLSFLLLGKMDEPETPGNPGRTSNRIQLSRNSPLGIFIRRAQLEFARLQFSDSISLWQKLASFRRSTWPQWKKRNPLSSYNGVDINLDADASISQMILADRLMQPEYNIVDTAFSSTEDAEKMLEHQVSRIQRLGTRIPEEVLTALKHMLRSESSAPNLSYYVNFLEAWKMCDYPASFDNLHRYFDYTMHSRDRSFYQYALLNLAALHADFGAYAEAMTCIRETIATAREHNDMACLNYSLSWLYHFSKVHPAEFDRFQDSKVAGSDAEALNFLKAKTKENGMWCIFSTCLLGEARVAVAKGDAPWQALQTVLKASHVNLSKNLENLAGTELALVSTIFGRLGLFCQSMLSEDILRCCYGASVPFEDRLQCQSRIAFQLSQRGRFTAAIKGLEQVNDEDLRVFKYQRFWTVQIGLLRVRRSLHRNQLDVAARILQQIQPRSNATADHAHDVTVLQIDVLVRKREYADALKLLEELAKDIDKGPFDVYRHVKIMVLKASVLHKAGVSQKGFSVALRAAHIAYTAKLFAVLWEAIAALGAILNSMKEFKATLEIVESIMPQVLEGASCYLTATCFSVLADAHVGLAGELRSNKYQCQEQLSGAVENLTQGFDEYSRIQDNDKQCEMLAKKATIMRMNGDEALANDYAAQYLAVKKDTEDR